MLYRKGALKMLKCHSVYSLKAQNIHSVLKCNYSYLGLGYDPLKTGTYIVT